MKVYVVEEFLRNDEYLEYGSKVRGVFSNLDEAKKYIDNNIDTISKEYKSKLISKPEDNFKYYCCYDNDPNGKETYADYYVIAITEHELN